jgi:hypothetical protein
MELLLRHGAHIYPVSLKLLDLYAPAHIVALAKQFPVHSLPKREMYPSVFIWPPEAQIQDID